MTFTTCGATFFRILLVLVFFLSERSSGQALTSAFTFTIIDVPNALGQTYATGINNRGEIVGWYHDNTGDHGFLRSSDGSSFNKFDNPAGIGRTSVQGINDTGFVTGYFFDSADKARSFLARSDGSGVVNIADLGASGYTYAHGINDSGMIVGHFFRGSSDVHGFLRNADGSYITVDDPAAPTGAIGTQGTVARAINDLGQIVGFLPGLNGNAAENSGFLRSSDGSVYTMITASNSRGTVATGINNNGDITGYFDNSSAATLGFIRTKNGTFTPFEVPNANHGQTFPRAINDNGRIVGYFYDDSGAHGFLASPKADQTPPLISGMPGAGCTLWPPNHKLVRVATVTATAVGSELASFNVSAVSNEPSAPGEVDIAITGNGIQPRDIQLRQERLGGGNGRVYTLVATATDLAGNMTTLTSTCTVPHDHGRD